MVCSLTTLTADCQSVKWHPQHASDCQWQSVAVTFVLFFANDTNIVANCVKKWHKVKENSSNIFKIANIGKHWQKEAQLRNRIKWNKFYIVLRWYKQIAAKSRINFTLSFNGIKSLLKIEGQDKKQKAVKCSTSKWQGMVQKSNLL